MIGIGIGIHFPDPDQKNLWLMLFYNEYSFAWYDGKTISDIPLKILYVSFRFVSYLLRKLH